MGRQGRTLTWLKEMGYDQPKEDVITCDFAYSSVFMKPKDPSLFDDVGFFVSADPNGEQPTSWWGAGAYGGWHMGDLRRRALR